MKRHQTGLGRIVLLLGAVPLLFVAGACGSGSHSASNILHAGQVNIQLPPGWRVIHDGVVAPAQAGGGISGSGLSASTTIPLNKQNPTTAFFQATTAFSSCLKGLGVTFIGAPTPNNPNSPTNDPNYLKALGKCASQSGILQALKAFQSSQNNLTPKQIQQENSQYLKWRTCMIGRGWTIPTPTPDSQGRLFSLNLSSSGPQMVPPPGESLTNSPDIQACATVSSGTSGKG